MVRNDNREARLFQAFTREELVFPTAAWLQGSALSIKRLFVFGHAGTAHRQQH